MTTALLPTWLFNHESLAEAFRNIREAVKLFSTKRDRIYPLGVGIDLRGPRIHTGKLVDVSIIKGFVFKKINIYSICV